MKKYSITKYHRSYNSKAVEDWTSISDIGKCFGGKELSCEAYMKVEDSYVNAIFEIIKYMKIEKCKVKNLFRWKNIEKEIISFPEKEKLYTKEMIDIYKKLQNNDYINMLELNYLIRLELREDIGGLIFVPYRLKIFIGYDYMMGVHSSVSLENIFENIREQDLTIYRFS